MKSHLVIRFCLAATVLLVTAVPLPAVIITNWVYNTNNLGPGSLHAAITNANANSLATNYIHFNITTNESGPATGPFTIRPTSQLPLITARVTIDGYTQPGASPNTLEIGNNAVMMIELNGTNALGANTDGLQIFGPVSIRGLVINSFRRHGIHHLDIGAAVHNGRIQGCFIGTDTTGTVGLGNGGMGVFIEAASSTIGGTNVADRNVISGNGSDGIAMEDDSHVIQNNYIGTDKHGTNIVGNGGTGIGAGRGSIFGSTNNPAAGRNVVAANATGGIYVGDHRNTVVGNYIGTDAYGVSRPGFGNGGSGIQIYNGNSNTIGGTISGRGNIIAGNGDDGVAVAGELTVGFFTNGVANLILGNSIYGNGSSVSSDGKIGIDLLFINTPGEVSTNDPCDLDYDSFEGVYDNGGNRFQNFPVLTSATSTTSNITIVGWLDSASNTNYLLEFFASSQCDPSGFGEGETFIGRTNLNAGADCSNAFSFTFPVAVADGKFITATASRVLLTNAVYETSEFSQCIMNAGPAGLPMVTIISTVVQGNNLCLSWTAPGETTSFVQAAPTIMGVFANISPPIMLPPGPQAATNYCDVGTLTNSSARWYRIAVQN